jgi:O-antigen/teichoic acid export membrane protein
VGKLLGGTGVLSQIMRGSGLRFLGLFTGALSQVYVARVMGPEKMGISGIGLVIASVGLLWVSFGLDTMLVRDAAPLWLRRSLGEDTVEGMEAGRALLRIVIDSLSLRIGLAVLFTLIFLSGWFFIGELGVGGIHADHSMGVGVGAGVGAYFLSLCCVPFLVLFQGCPPLWFFQAARKVPTQYMASVIASVVGAICIVVMVRPTSPAGLDLLALTIGSGASFFFLGWRVFVTLKPPFFGKDGFGCAVLSASGVPGLGRLWKLAVSARWLLLTAVVNYGYTKADQPILGWLGTVKDLGLYRSALQVTNAVYPFLAMVPLFLYPKLIEWHGVSLEELWRRQKGLFVSWVFPIVVAVVVLAVVMPWVYPWVFGSKYSEAALPCTILLGSKLEVVLSGIFCWGIWTLKRDGAMLCMMVVVALSAVTLDVLMIPRFGMLAAASINCLSEGIVLIASGLMMWHFVRVQRRKGEDNGGENAN